MDNFYSSPFLFYSLKLASTGAVRTLRRNRSTRNPASKIETGRGKGKVLWQRNKYAENV